MSSPSGIDNTSSIWIPASPTPPVNPFNQTVTLSDPYGNPFEVTLTQFNYWAQYAIRVNIIWGCQIGAAFTLLLLLLILTKHEKRRSPIFIFNILALVLCIIRGVLFSLYYTGNWYDAYSYMALDYSRITPTDIGTSIAASVMSLCLTICVEISLIMQAYIVCITVKRCYRIVITVLSALVALTVIGIRFAFTVWMCMMTMGSVSFIPNYLLIASDVSLSVSIIFFCLVFCGKLGLAIRNRRKLGLKQFGPMQIIFIMGAQTLVIPSKSSALLISLTSTHIDNYRHILRPPILHHRRPRVGSLGPDRRLRVPSALIDLGRC